MAGVIAVALATLFGVLTTLIVVSAAMDDTDIERGGDDEHRAEGGGLNER